MALSLRCSSCRGKFPWAANTGMPEFCALCGERIGHDRADDDVVMPFVRTTPKTASIDKVYRDMESGSAFRAKAAAELTGAPVDEMASLKITDMRDNQKPGDYAVPEVNNAVSQFMAAHPQSGGFKSGEGLAYGDNVRTGPLPNSGAKMRTALQNYHGRFTGGTAVSDRPALETLQHGYNRRG
jgi:hypothetical protein